MMFWNDLLNSNINSLLQKEDTTLFHILDEDDVLQECKGKNQELISFLIIPTNLNQLVNLILTEPSEETDEKTRYKYPHIACELLTSEVVDIYEKLSSDDDLMNKLYGFLESNEVLNPLLASFFSKVMGLLISQKSELLLSFIKSRENFIERLLHHMGTSAIMDFLLRLISCMEIPEVKLNCINWLNEQNLVNKLVDLIHPSQSEEKHCNSSQALCDIIRVSRQEIAQNTELSIDESPLLNSIEAKETVTRLLQNMFNSEKVESVLVNGITVIRTLLEFRVIKDETIVMFDENFIKNNQKEEFNKSFFNTLDVVEQFLNEFHHLLLEPPKQHYSQMNTTVGKLDPPLGNTRLQVARLVSTMLLCYKLSFFNMLIKLGTMKVLLDLFFKYSLCNFFHTEVEKCVGTILMGGSSEEENNIKKPLVIHLFKDCKLLEVIVSAYKDYSEGEHKSCQKYSFMGHLYQISNHINDCYNKNDNSTPTKEVFSELSEESKEEWEKYVTGSLSEINKTNLITNVNPRQVPSSSEDDEPELPNMHFPPGIHVQQAYSELQMQQMSSNFTNSFGFHEEGFNDAEDPLEAPFTNWKANIQFDFSGNKEATISERLFEQACNERMQEFDQTNSDDEEFGWEDKEVHLVPFSRGTVSSGTCQSDEDRSQSNESDGSSDSEEDLDSPAVIKQMATSSAEKMDIDHSTAWCEEFPADEAVIAPVAMDTGVGWNTPTVTSSTDNNWANFGNDSTFNVEVNSEENWADFTAISSIDESKFNFNSAMDTADMNVNASRTSAYRVDNTVNIETEVSSSSDEISDNIISDFPIKATNLVSNICEPQVSSTSDACINSNDEKSGVVNIDLPNSSEV